MQMTTRSFPPEVDGTVTTTADGRAVLRFERRLNHPVERGWQAVSTPAELEACFDLSRHSRHVDTIFARVFGDGLEEASDRRAL